MAKILIVDDDKDLLEMVAVLLRSEGHEVVPVSDGFEAIERIESVEPFDLMLLDLRMAPVDGIEVLETARRERPPLDVIVISAYLDDETLRRITELGVVDHVCKPFSLEDILGPIREVFSRHTWGG
ncbi:MAG: response regulator [Spartobacteria bacterium]|nr:response regulator [Spartobacteria bacterium]